MIKRTGTEYLVTQEAPPPNASKTLMRVAISRATHVKTTPSKLKDAVQKR